MPFCEEAAFCVLLADVAAGFAASFAVVAGFAAGVEWSDAAGALAAGGAVEGFVAEDCRPGAVPAKMKVAVSTQIAMLGSFRMDLVSQRFGARANGGNCEICSVLPRRYPRGVAGAAAPLRECERAQARSDWFACQDGPSDRRKAGPHTRRTRPRNLKTK